MDGRADVAAWQMRSTGLNELIALLVERFDEVIGPVVADDAIRMRPITSVQDLPTGVTDEQETGSYRLIPTASRLRFSYGPGPDSLKQIVHPPRTPVWTMHRRDGSLAVEQPDVPQLTRAVIGARACDIRALAKLARTQTAGDHADEAFASRHAGLAIVAVDCTAPAPTCFCDTAGGSHQADEGYDLALTELESADGHIVYLVRAGSDFGRRLVDELHLAPATDRMIGAGVDAMRQLPSPVRELPADAREAVGRLDHARWDAVAERCLACGNCTAVCPTCFCSDVDDRVSLDGSTATRDRVWDSCFSLEYSRLGESPVRTTVSSRYRQWLSHKLGTWHDHFGESGCVGCGRCITWCPVGIDLTAEVEALGRPSQEPEPVP